MRVHPRSLKIFPKQLRGIWRLFLLLSAFHLSLLVLPVSADDNARIQKALERGLPIIQKSAATYAEERSCFSCHHQTLPLQAMISARSRGIKIDEPLVKSQAQLTHDSFKARLSALKDGTGIGGKSMTVGFGLWALDLAGWHPNATTDAMVRYLLKTQEEDGRFWSNIDRPPLEDSPFTATTVAAYYLQKFAPDDSKADVQSAVARAQSWLARMEPKTQEDLNSKLWGLHLLRANDNQIKSLLKLVLAAQREDGGWNQLSGMASDAYATGQTLFVLKETGLAVSDAAYQRGVQFLLDTQLEDGTWHVKTRSRPIQTFFDSGFPHDKDQFISICATSWALVALAAAYSTGL